MGAVWSNRKRQRKHGKVFSPQTKRGDPLGDKQHVDDSTGTLTVTPSLTWKPPSCCPIKPLSEQEDEHKHTANLFIPRKRFYMRLCISSPLLKNILECLEGLSAQATFDFGPSGLDCQLMDMGHSCIIILHLDPSDCVEFDAPRTGSFSFHVKTLVQMTKAGGDCTTELVVDDKNPDKLKIRVLGGGIPMRECVMALLSIDSERMDPPDLEADCRFEIDVGALSTDLADAVKLDLFNCNIVADKEHIAFLFTGDMGNMGNSLKTLYTIAESDAEGDRDAASVDSDAGKRKRDAGDLEAVSQQPVRKKGVDKRMGPRGHAVAIDSVRPANIAFAVKYLTLATAKPKALNPTATFAITNDVPMEVTYRFGASEMKVYVAPLLAEQ